jgi:hypothetical protein
MEFTMKKMNSVLRRFCAVVLSASLLSGCSYLLGEKKPVVAGETISGDSKWINSDIDGAIEEDTPVNPKDDFYTAVNRDWLLKTKLSDEVQDISMFTENEKVLRDRKMDIVRDKTVTARRVGRQPRRSSGVHAAA